MDTIRQDLAFAARSLRKSPGFFALATVCLALGIAANVFVWSPINALLIKNLPYRDSPRVMHLSAWETTGSRRTYGSWSYPDYADVAQLTDVFSSVGAHTSRSWNVGGGGEPERLEGARVSASLFPMLGLEPALGRFFRPDEDAAGKVVVIGYGVWERKFGADSAIIGRMIPLDGEPYTVIGVMQRGVRVPETEDLWVPIAPGDARGHREWRFYQVTARLAPNVTIEQADARLVSLMRQLEEQYGNTNARTSGWVVPMNELVAREVRPIFLIMLGAVGFVLLIACANVANLLLARGSARQREVAVRLAMGASRVRIVRQLLTESLLLAAAGGALGLLLGTWAIDLFIARMMPTTVPFWMTFEIDQTIVLITVATTALTGLIFGVAPALQLSRPSLTETLKESGGRGSSAHARAGQTRSALVVAELALSIVLLVGAGLMVRSFLETQNARLGFQQRNLLTFELSPAGERYANDSARTEFYRLLEERLTALPGVRAVGSTTQLPVASCCSHNYYHPEGREYPPTGGPNSAHYTAVSPGFFAAMGISILAGRGFEARDIQPGNRVTVVDSVLAAREWPNASPLGKQIRMGSATGPAYTVVGVMQHVVQRDVNEEVGPQVLVPSHASSRAERAFALRTDGDPAAAMTSVRAVVRDLDPDLPVAKLATMEFVVRNRMFQPRVYGSMFSIFAGVALLLAMIGLYGVMSYVVAQRTHELGVRMALGAERGAVVGLVMRSGARLIAVGLALGVPAAIALSQLLRGALYGVSASDPATLVGIPLLLTAVALLATYVPARRATRVDPMIALRSE